MLMYIYSLSQSAQVQRTIYIQGTNIFVAQLSVNYQIKFFKFHLTTYIEKLENNPPPCACLVMMQLTHFYTKKILLKYTLSVIILVIKYTIMFHSQRIKFKQLSLKSWRISGNPTLLRFNTFPLKIKPFQTLPPPIL